MKIKHRRALVAVTAFFWADWIACLWAQMSMEVGVWHRVCTAVLMMLTGMASVAVILAYLVSPLMATARVWLEIGRREQERECDCAAQRHAVNAGHVIPIRPLRKVTHSDS